MEIDLKYLLYKALMATPVPVYSVFLLLLIVSPCTSFNCMVFTADTFAARPHLSLNNLEREVV